MSRFFQPEGYNFQDFDLLVEDGTLYAMFIKKVPYPQRHEDAKPPNRYGMAKTHDGIHWEDMGDSILPGKPGSWDESMWAGGISKQDARYVIYYSATTIKGRCATCKIGKAYSTDLIHWEKETANPVLVLDSANPYYSDEPELAFRDPFFFEHEGKRYIIFCAKDKNQPAGKQGCVGIAEEISQNNFSWLPPLYSPGTYFDGLECPALYNLDGTWYLLYGQDGENGGKAFRYAISDSLFGPFKEFSDNQLLSTNNYTCRIVDFNGKRLLYHWFIDYPNGIVRSRVAPPKEVHIVNHEITLKENGRISLSDLEN